MPLQKALCWALTFTIRIRFLSGTLLAMVLKTNNCAEPLSKKLFWTMSVSCVPCHVPFDSSRLW